MKTIYNSGLFKGVSVNGQNVEGLAKGGVIFYKKTIEPSIQSWVISPNNGTGPFTATAVFELKNMIDGTTYGLRITERTTTGSCVPALFDGTIQTAMTAAILNSDTYNFSGAPSANRCRDYGLFIYRIADNAIISELHTTISNI